MKLLPGYRPTEGVETASGLPHVRDNGDDISFEEVTTGLGVKYPIIVHDSPVVKDCHPSVQVKKSNSDTREIYSTIVEDVHLYCNNLVLNEKCEPALLRVFDGNSTASLGFVFEKELSSYSMKRAYLDTLPDLHPERIEHLDTLTFTFPNLNTGVVQCQASIPVRASVCHYQTMCSTFVDAAKRNSEGCVSAKFQVLYPNRNYSTNECFVQNENVPHGLSKAEKRRLLEMALGTTDIKSLFDKEDETNGEKRQQFHQDYLWCCNMNQSRKGSVNGLALPRFKDFKGLSSEDVRLLKKLFVAISKWVQSVDLKWLPQGSKAFTCNSDRGLLFAESFHSMNALEALCLAATIVVPGVCNKRCGKHRDLHNSRWKEYEGTPTFSFGVACDGYLFRFSAIGNSRLSIDHVYEKMQEQGPYIQNAWNQYQKLEEHRKSLTQKNIKPNATLVKGPSDVPCFKQPCNVDPCGHVGTFVEWIVRLNSKFNLSMLERISVVRAIGVLPNSPYVFGLACQALIQKRGTLERRHRLYFNFGYLLAKLITTVRQSLKDDSKFDNPPLRHSIYRQPVLGKIDEFNIDCEGLLSIVIKSRRSNGTVS